MITTAVISECGRYRYSLVRVWDADKPMLCYIGLNPSTADATVDDPTIRRLIEFTKAFGYGGFTIVNLFAWRATQPKELLLEDKRKGLHNDYHIQDAAKACDNDVVFCWGTWGGIFGRDEEVIRMFPNARCFGLTKDGHPKHPLYLHSSTQLITFKR